ncbi:MAG TPA: HNH endonuclease, partial [Polyangiales bacterium]|nr:HNH endonuclease [Polyangiales bacterium]
HPSELNQTPASKPREITQLDEELYRLARGAGRLRLRIGQALHRLADGIHELGFSTLHAYALERCNRGGRWAAESRTLARRLESLPQLAAALEAGSIGWSMAELLARHATPQTEAALLQVARGKTVHAMRIALGHQASPSSASAPSPASSPSALGSSDSPNTPGSPSAPEPAEDDELTRTLSLTVPLEEAWALEATRMMVEHMDGKHSASHFLESLLAEGTISLLELVDAENDTSEQMEAEHTAWREHVQRLQHLQAQAELRSRPAVSTAPHPGEAPHADDLPTGLEALDARIRHYSAELASRDLFFGRMAQRFLGLGGWQALGFSSEAHYAHERLGMSRAALRSKISLARRSRGFDHVVDALQQGRIGFEAAQLIARIATDDTERAWVDRATHRTFKHLREEVQAVEMATRFAGQTDRAPPSEEHIQQMQALERAILSGELLRKVANQHTSAQSNCVQISVGPGSEALSDGSDDAVQISGSPTDEALHEASDDAVQISVSPDEEPPAVQISATSSNEAKNEAFNEPVQISGTPHGKVTLRLRVPGDLLLHYRQLERLHRQVLPGTSFIQFLCATFWRTWVPTLGVSDKWESIYRRDRYRCTSPVCHQRNVTLHHVQYRAHGGTDDPDNLTCPCAFCHLEGEHGGRLKILPPGDDPTWILGRHPIMRVHHRERTLFN